MNEAKLVIGGGAAWALWAVGHVISRPMYRFDGFAWLYPAYCALMNWSSDMQDWSGAKGPWGEPEWT
jgi:hypothetical protein